MSEKLVKGTLVEGRVAGILNERELVINIGEEKGVRLEMKFAVLSESPLEIRDPENNVILDTVDREKVRVKVIEVREKIAICRTYRIRRTPGGPYNFQTDALSNLFKAPKEAVETLAAKDATLPPPLSPEESYVKINDRVRQVVDDE